jgi:hypothetical protein
MPLTGASEVRRAHAADAVRSKYSVIHVRRSVHAGVWAGACASRSGGADVAHQS